jgi:polyphosphate kinase
MGALLNLNRPDLKYKPWVPVAPEPFRDRSQSIFESIQARDVLVHHPYESFHHSVELFIESAVNDPHVLAIKMALYRTGNESPFIPLLMRAASEGKQVVCLVELKASFDEQRNIQVARSLEKAGVHVVYGIVGLKTHCKVALIVRQEGDEVKSYAHIGTGNYHSNTSLLYTDLGLFTAKQELTEDLSKLFNYLTGKSVNQVYKKLIIAPLNMKDHFLDLIAYETRQAANGLPARIIGKMNSIEDPDIINALYTASQAGVKIDLIVRGFCCLRPQVPGMSQHIRILSIIGRFLEHSRIFFFQHANANPLDGLYFIGSADWMSRNLAARVEAIVPIDDPSLKSRIFEILHVMLNDHRQAWELGSDGVYRQRRPATQAVQYGSHDIQMKMCESPMHWPSQILLA